MTQATLWYFNSQDSIPYFLNQLGYVFFAFSALLLGYKFLYEKGLLKVIGILLWISGVLSILAFVGLTLKIDLLTFCSIISGLLTVPIGVIVIIWGRRSKEDV